MPKKTWTRAKFADKISKSRRTLQRWDEEGILKSFTDSDNNPYYTDEHYGVFLQAVALKPSRQIRKNEQAKALLETLSKSMQEKANTIYDNARHLHKALKPELTKARPISSIDKKFAKTYMITLEGIPVEVVTQNGIKEEVAKDFVDRIDKVLENVASMLRVPARLVLAGGLLQFAIVDEIYDEDMDKNANAMFSPSDWTVSISEGATNISIAEEIIHNIDFFAGMVMYKNKKSFSENIQSKIDNRGDKSISKILRDASELELPMIHFLLFANKNYKKRMDALLDGLKIGNSKLKKYVLDTKEMFARFAISKYSSKFNREISKEMEDLKIKIDENQDFKSKRRVVQMNAQDIMPDSQEDKDAFKAIDAFFEHSGQILFKLEWT